MRARIARQRDNSAGEAPSLPRASETMWRPVRGGNAFEITVGRLMQAIKLGVVAVGERLPAERDLAEQLHVSRVTLREAISALREAGLLESRRGRTGGTFVLAPGPSGRPRTAAAGRTNGVATGARVLSKGVRADATKVARAMGETLPDALDFRRVVEGGAAYFAASRSLAAAERQQLVSCLIASRERDPAIRRRNDSRLHLAIAAVAGSTSLTASIADVQLTLDRLLGAIPVLRRNLDHSDAQHTRIVDAILAGDPANARAAMEEHCDGTAELLRGLLG